VRCVLVTLLGGQMVVEIERAQLLVVVGVVWPSLSLPRQPPPLISVGPAEAMTGRCHVEKRAPETCLLPGPINRKRSGQRSKV